MAQVYPVGSPKWSWPTKLVVGISFVLAFAWLLNRFKEFIGPLILAFILTYLSYPVAGYLRRQLKLSWRVSVTVFYVVLIILLVGLVAAGGLVLLEQGQSLFNLIQQTVLVTLPDLVDNLSKQVITVGRFHFDLSKLDLQTINNQILGAIQPAIGQVGTLLGKIATSAASFLGWVSFIILVSYFLTSESGGKPGGFININVPGYSTDLRRITEHLDRIWSIFLRNQFVLFALTVIIFLIVLTVLGVHYPWGLALVSGFGRFLPYVGPFIAWTALGLVAYFQGSTIFGLSALGYVILAVGTAIVIDSLFDNFISPKFFGSTLQVHPAAVLITALVAANMIGFIGVLVSAPVLATIQLLVRYALRKMFDLDPWAEAEVPPVPPVRPLIPRPLSNLVINLIQGIKRPIKSRADPANPKQD